MEILVSVLEAAVIIILLLLLGWFICGRPPMRLGGKRKAERQADELLRAVLTGEQYCQLIQQGYVDIPSPSDPQRVYRVPQGPGSVQVREEGRLKMRLCLQPLEWVPSADVVVIHKLLIEADEEVYLQTANHLISWSLD